MAGIGAGRLLHKRAEEPALDVSTLRKCRQRDAEAFAVLVDRYQVRVFGYVRRMVGTIEDAEDISQEVFVRAFQGIDRFDGRASITTWLFRIANNLCIDRQRRLKRRPVETSLESSVDSTHRALEDARWDPEGHAIVGELGECIERAVAEMSEKLKTVLLLHDKEELSYEQIADIMSVPVGTVKSRLFLARGQLQRALRNYQHPGEIE